ncbi:MAG TPA: M23 family metallopeptidase [Thermomonospora sp.]|nr:M23 family metallopeptidase [Thermomonospora sp.]
MMLLARLRTLLVMAGVALTFTAPLHGRRWLTLAGFALILTGMTLMFLPAAAPRRPPVRVASPVRGRWLAVNSPADRVPSHGTHEFAQTYAVDLLYHPDPRREWKGVHRWPLARRPQTFPSFGQPLYAPADGVVVRAVDGQRDHWSRNSWPGLVYLLVVEGIVRGVASVLSPRFVLGNHVVLDLGDGVHAVLAHLRRGSLRVRPGQRVRAGEQVAECGNSGNSSEPHLHFQLMDGPRAVVAAGIPMTFEYRVDDVEHYGVPEARRPFTAGPRTGG